jgi:serine/threonine protein kinase
MNFLEIYEKQNSSKKLNLDIYPSNILIDENDNIKIANFGFSKSYV